MDPYAVAERWPDGEWHQVAVAFAEDPIDAILVVAGEGAQLVAKGAAARGWAAQAATCDPSTGDPTLIRIRMFRSVRTRPEEARRNGR